MAMLSLRRKKNKYDERPIMKSNWTIHAKNQPDKKSEPDKKGKLRVGQSVLSIRNKVLLINYLSIVVVNA